ncbi:hypothetical protein G9A89_001533 [Geosiphon pyriformis]|nr:hypothetical protein G9A89_001533 [Geosiphon pyriformis]
MAGVLFETNTKGINLALFRHFTILDTWSNRSPKDHSKDDKCSFKVELGMKVEGGKPLEPRPPEEKRLKLESTERPEDVDAEEII